MNIQDATGRGASLGRRSSAPANLGGRKNIEAPSNEYQQQVNDFVRSVAEPRLSQ